MDQAFSLSDSARSEPTHEPTSDLGKAVVVTAASGLGPGLSAISLGKDMAEALRTTCPKHARSILSQIPVDGRSVH